MWKSGIKMYHGNFYVILHYCNRMQILHIFSLNIYNLYKYWRKTIIENITRDYLERAEILCASCIMLLAIIQRPPNTLLRENRVPDIEVYFCRPMGTNSRPFDIVPTKRTDRGERYRRHIIQDAISVRTVSIKILAIRHDIRKRSENFPRACHDLLFAKAVVLTTRKGHRGRGSEKVRRREERSTSYPTNRK